MRHDTRHAHLLADIAVSCVARARRFIGPAALVDPVVAGNPLSYDPSEQIEYLIHGQFKRTEDDRNGLFGAWWLSLDTLVEQLGAEAVQAELEQFEEAQKDARQERMRGLARATAAEPEPEAAPAAE